MHIFTFKYRQLNSLVKENISRKLKSADEYPRHNNKVAHVVAHEAEEGVYIADTEPAVGGFLHNESLFVLYFFGTFFQSSRNLSMPISVRGCLDNCSMTLNGMVAICAPKSAASTTCRGCLTLATITSVAKS